MYVAVVAGFMFVLPLLSTAIALLVNPAAAVLPTNGQWFVFWAVGMRLFTAGLRQVFRPEFTARTIFGVRDPAAFTVVTELGVSNMAIGALALASVVLPAWRVPVAVYALLFYGAAAVKHLSNAQRNRTESIATWSDLWAAMVLAAYLVGTFLTR